MKIFTIFRNLLLLTFSYLFFLLFFYNLSNNLYFEAGKVVDYSIYAWIGMFLIWGIALYRYFHKKYDVIYFAVQLVFIIWAFDCWRLFIYGGVQSMKPIILGISGFEVFLGILAVVLHNHRLMVSSLICSLIIFGGGYVVLPRFMSFENMLLLSGIISICYGLILGAIKFKTSFKIVFSFIMLFILGVGSWFYTLTDGIHFYEKKITEMPKDIKVSVIVPVYNAEKTLERCLDSIRKQTLKEIEIICVNDGSIDNSRAILEKYANHDKRFVVINQKNAYVGAARNKGIELAKGKYVGFIDSDDWISLNYFEEMYKKAEKTQADIVVTEKELFIDNAHSRHIKKIVNRSYYNDDYYTVDRITPLLNAHVWNKAYRRQFLQEHHILFPTFRSNGEDLHFIFKILLNKPLVAVAPHTVYNYTYLGASLTRWEKTEKLKKIEMLELFNGIERLLIENSASDILFEDYKQKRQIFLNSLYLILDETSKKELIEKFQRYFPNSEVDFTKSDKD